MSILPSSLTGFVPAAPRTSPLPPGEGGGAHPRPAAGETPGARVPSTPHHSAGAPSSLDPGVPEASPRGVDPALWALLTGEERAHFTRTRAMGPLTYGRAPAAEGEAAPMRGVRLDVKV
ncbi:MAG: hypothetical protein EA421_08960 [Gemmatimonadales bacterium]|nr:MAG: hypothetical protein EA421_08960 [Gemmatimonadales bacterium]